MTIVQQIRQRVLHHESEYLWDARISDPDTWSDEQLDAAEAVVATVLTILDDVEHPHRCDWWCEDEWGRCRMVE